MNELKSNVVGMPAPLMTKGQRRTATAQGAINVIQANFKKLTNDDVGGTWVDEGVTKPKAISYGAYNQLTYRGADGYVLHACGQSITDMRDARPFTRNAVELRCDALGLAVYISGVNQIDTKTNRLREYLRVATYQYGQSTPDLSIAEDSAALYGKVHTILVSTYNHLAREYNIAGLTATDLTLISDSQLIPNVVINHPC